MLAGTLTPPRLATECRSDMRWPFIVLLPLWLSGCRFHVELIEDGRLGYAREFNAIEVGESDLGDVLAAFGPPDGVSHTRTTEILEYRNGVHRGTDLAFLLPFRANPVSSLANGIRGALNLVFPEFDEHEEFDRKEFTERASRAVIELLFAFTPLSFSTEDSVTLHDRRLRYDVIQFVLGRDSNVVQRKEQFLGIEVGRSESLVDATLLITR